MGLVLSFAENNKLIEITHSNTGSTKKDWKLVFGPWESRKRAERAMTEKEWEWTLILKYSL